MVSPARRGRKLPYLTLALLVALFLTIPGGPVVADGTTETIDTFMGGYKNASLEFRDSTYNGMLWFNIPTNATVLRANVTVTGIEGPIPRDDVIDFSTGTVGTDVWASYKGAKGLSPPTVDPYNNTWTRVDATGIANLKADDARDWHTQTPSTPTAAPWEWPVQLFHFQYDDAANATEIEVVWNGHGECTANGAFQYQATSYMYSHTTSKWLEAQGYASTMGRDEWMNYSLDSGSQFISSNGSIDLAVIGPHANKTATASDFGHLYTDYVGLVAKVANGSSEYPTDVVMEFDNHDYVISTGPLTGSVVVGDGFGFKDRIQAYIDRQPGWVNDTGVDLEFHVGKKTYAKVNVSDLEIVYTVDGGTIPNLPPRWVGPDMAVVEEDSDWTDVVDLDAAFTDDHDQGFLVYQVEGVSETWLQTRIRQAPGGNKTLEVKPAPDRWGDVNVTLAATDMDGAKAVAPYLEVHVSPVPDAPALIPPGLLTAKERVLLRTTIGVDDPDLPDDYLTFSDDSDLFDIKATDGTIEWTPGPEHIGSHTCIITVTDFLGLTDAITITIEVENVNDGPVITSTDRIEAEEGDLITYQVVAEDEDVVHGDSLTYSAWSIHVDVHLDTATGLLTLQLETGTIGEIEVVVMVADMDGASTQLTLTVDITNVNDPPTVEPMGPLSYDEGDQVTVRLIYDDPDMSVVIEPPETLTVVTDGPEWLEADAQGWIGFTAEQSMVGEHLVTYTVTDRAGLSTSVDVLWTIVNVNDAPVITTQVPEEELVIEGEAFSRTYEATDEDGDTLTWSDDSDLFDIDPSAGTLQCTPVQADVGTHAVTLSVSDGNGGVATVTFDLEVENLNDAPVITSVLPEDGTSFRKGELVRFSVVATDPDGDLLSYYWMEGAVELGAGTPFSTQDLGVGVHTITLVVSDGVATAERTFDVEIISKDGTSDDDGGLPVFLIVMLLVGIVTAALFLHTLLMGRKGPDTPLM